MTDSIEAAARAIAELWWNTFPINEPGRKEWWINENWRSYIDQAKAAIAAYRDALWQPIETAPKDGTVVLVCGKNARGSYYVTDAKWYCGAWCLFDCAEDSHTYPSDYHTHWQPIPEPPKEPT